MLRRSILTLGISLTCMMPAFGAVSSEEAARLGSTFTAIGAEKTGNADGTIPAYTGGLKTPATFKKGSGVRPDPFADEKPLLSINPKNADKYSTKLTEGSKALLKKYPTYRIDVYKTHRTVSFPHYVQDGTAKNAVTAKAINGGISIQNATNGIPFPIPKDGNEAMWNHLLRYSGEAMKLKYKSWNIDASGRRTLGVSATVHQQYPYYDRKNPSVENYYMIKAHFEDPPRRSGEALMLIDPLDFTKKGRRAWQYLPGQRRVKLAPDLSFDTPNPANAGATTYDDVNIFNGSMERYTFRLIGKKEIYVPYNAYKAVYETKPEALCLPRHVNPDYLRWELHRVWVVEASLKPGKRHIYSKRVFYLDEDSWAAVASEQYDARGQLFRTSFSLLTYSYDIQAPFTDPITFYDLVAGTYTLSVNLGDKGSLHYINPLSDKQWSPDSLAGSGIR